MPVEKGTMQPSDYKQLPVKNSSSTVPSAPNRTFLVTTAPVVASDVDPAANSLKQASSSPLQSRQYHLLNASLVAPPSRHQFLQATNYDVQTSKSVGNGEANAAAAAAFLWRRNGSELDLEGKISQELEVGYKWLPPTPAKPVQSQTITYQSSQQYPRSAVSLAANGSTPTRSTKMQLDSIKPRIIEVQHQQPDTVPDQRPKNPNDTFPDKNAGDRPDSVYFADGKRRIDFVLVYEQGVRLKPVDASRVGRSFVEKEKLRQFFQENLNKDGVELEEDVHQEENSAQITVFVKVHGTWSALCRQAEILKIKMPLRLRDTFAEEMDDRKPPIVFRYLKKLLKKLTGSDSGDSGDSASEKQGEGNAVTWAFQRKKIDKYAIGDQDTFFSPTQRMEMVWEILQKTRNDPSDEKKRGIEQLLELGVYDAAFPLHDGVAGAKNKSVPATEWCDRQMLRRTWASWRCMFEPQPLELIRKYYGEKIGFYFAFLGFYTKMLAFPAFVGLCTFFYGFSYNDDDVLVNEICHSELYMCPICEPPNCEPQKLKDACENAKWDYRMDNEATLAMACLTVVWATVFLKSWKRREAELAYSWDTYEVEQSDSVIRPEYEKRAPTRRHNPVTRELEPYVPATRRATWMAASIFVTLIMLALVAVALTLLVIMRIFLYGQFRHFAHEKSVELARWFVHGLIFVVVVIFDKIYDWIGRKTTSLECPRSQGQWLSSFLWKVFIFELLNDFVPIAYAAWVKGKSITTPLELGKTSESCDSGGCMGEVTELIAVLLLARLVVGNASEIAFPILEQFLSRFAKNRSSTNTLSLSASTSRSSSNSGTPDGEGEDDGKHQWNRDLTLGNLKLDGVAEEYMEMIVQFAFVTLFVPAFPVAPFVCLLNNILEIRVDAINFVVSHRRPLPIRVPGIQIWNSFLDIIAKTAILCNAGLMSFTSEVIPRLYYKYTKSAKTNYEGFTLFSLSKIPTEAWKTKYHNDTKRSFSEFSYMFDNVTECYYQHYRDPVSFTVTQEWWEIMCIRLSAFSIFIVAAFTFQWLYNFIVSDVPGHVLLKIQRRRYVVAKALEAEMAYDKWLKSALHGKTSTSLTPPVNVVNGIVRSPEMEDPPSPVKTTPQSPDDAASENSDKWPDTPEKMATVNGSAIVRSRPQSVKQSTAEKDPI